MSLSRKWIVGAALCSLLLAGCVSKVTEKEQYSGFLKSYDGLQETKSASGATVMRWVAPGFQPSAYSTLVFERLELYPAPKPNERVDMKTLQELQAYTTESARQALEQNYRVVPSTRDVRKGERALILHAAITGVTASSEGMKWYEVVPVAAVVGSIQAATGHRDQNTELYIEADLVDAGTGLPVAKAVRKVFGENLQNSSQKITANDFKAAIRAMTNDLQALLK
ncbi:Protein of unknown function [Pseudomonas sp. LAMO17WK12:I10]|uniref:DUF3313 domain-containing protein n=1 Tax=unclassified Pseudomonas TaxID=196821 RepID=UPI000BD072BC|nr:MULTISPECIES: DUF3313 domain-containing protein [unclassified Pseudomonas]PXX51586.1 uncharacterized protein DUF3313 [Pseudomonas sp. LAMO17WK12:I9]SNY53675.1 Protein of unknown function [Pseudomonas sp. LAMO17WK12:I10]